MNTYKIVTRIVKKNSQGQMSFFEQEIGREIAKNAPTALRQMWQKAIELGIVEPHMEPHFSGRSLSVLGVGVFQAKKIASAS